MATIGGLVAIGAAVGAIGYWIWQNTIGARALEKATEVETNLKHHQAEARQVMKTFEGVQRQFGEALANITQDFGLLFNITDKRILNDRRAAIVWDLIQRASYMMDEVSDQWRRGRLAPEIFRIFKNITLGVNTPKELWRPLACEHDEEGFFMLKLRAFENNPSRSLVRIDAFERATPVGAHTIAVHQYSGDKFYMFDHDENFFQRISFTPVTPEQVYWPMNEKNCTKEPQTYDRDWLLNEIRQQGSLKAQVKYSRDHLFVYCPERHIKIGYQETKPCGDKVLKIGRDTHVEVDETINDQSEWTYALADDETMDLEWLQREAHDFMREYQSEEKERLKESAKNGLARMKTLNTGSATMESESAEHMANDN